MHSARARGARHGDVLVSTFEFAGPVSYGADPRKSASPDGLSAALRVPASMVLAAPCVSARGSRRGPRRAVPVYGYEVVHTYPHDPTAFTEDSFI